MKKISIREKYFNMNSYSNNEIIKIILFIIASVTLLLSRLYIIPQVTLLIVIGILSIMLFKGLIDEVELMLYSLILPSELYVFIGLVIAIINFLFKIIRKKVDIYVIIDDLKKDKYLHVFLGVVLISAIISIISTNIILNSAIYITYLIGMLMIFEISKSAQYSFKNLLRYMNQIFLIQFIITIIHGIQQFKNIGNIASGDHYTGTFSNAHVFCAWLICYLILLIKDNRYEIRVFFKEIIKYKKISINKKRLLDIIKILTSLLLIYLSDGKHLWIAFLLCVVVWNILNVIKSAVKYSVIISGIFILIGLFIVTNMTNISGFQEWISDKSNYITMYIYEEPFNTKFQYFNETLNKNMKGSNFFIGIGPGQYGSRVANLRAYEHMVKEDGLAKVIAKVLPPYVSKEYEDQASKYNEEFVAMIPYMSAVLAYPFSSIVALFAELGIFGYMAYLAFLNSKTKKNTKLSSLITLFFLFLMVFDSYMEMTSVIGMFWIIMGCLNGGSEY